MSIPAVRLGHDDDFAEAGCEVDDEFIDADAGVLTLLMGGVTDSLESARAAALLDNIMRTGKTLLKA